MVWWLDIRRKPYRSMGYIAFQTCGWPQVHFRYTSHLNMLLIAGPGLFAGDALIHRMYTSVGIYRGTYWAIEQNIALRLVKSAPHAFVLWTAYQSILDAFDKRGPNHTTRRTHIGLIVSVARGISRDEIQLGCHVYQSRTLRSVLAFGSKWILREFNET